MAVSRKLVDRFSGAGVQKPAAITIEREVPVFNEISVPIERVVEKFEEIQVDRIRFDDQYLPTPARHIGSTIWKLKGEREESEREIERRREKRLCWCFALHAPIQWAI